MTDIFSVSEVSAHLKNVLESNIPPFYIEGEITNFTKHASGHFYFSLRDENAVVRAVFFKQYNYRLNFIPQDGQKVICQAKITVYERAGNYQLNVNQMLLSGVGMALLKFEELKEKLANLGYFNQKRSLPKYPRTIGIITSPTGAAIEDIKNVLQRRFPVGILLYPALVQGENAVKTLIAGLEYFNRTQTCDIIIIGRGGGSYEDLEAFNSEELARELFASAIPTISAVGHEIDYTICDFVADLRAPTPSAAAELAVPDLKSVELNLTMLQKRLSTIAFLHLAEQKHLVQTYRERLSWFHPRKIWESYLQRLDEAETSILNIKGQWQAKNDILAAQKAALRKSFHLLVETGAKKTSLKTLEVSDKLLHAMRGNLARFAAKVEIVSGKLEELSPHAALRRGYALLRKEKKILPSICEITIGDKIEVLMSDGKLSCYVEGKYEENALDFVACSFASSPESGSESNVGMRLGMEYPREN